MQGKGCYFFDRSTIGGNYVRLRYQTPAPLWDGEPLPPEDQLILLCRHHLFVLRDAGTQGRLHAKTGIRWWLVAEPLRPEPRRRR